jgi:hypothetical protein
MLAEDAGWTFAISERCKSHNRPRQWSTVDYILSSVLSFKISHSRVVTADATAETI